MFSNPLIALASSAQAAIPTPQLERPSSTQQCRIGQARRTRKVNAARCSALTRGDAAGDRAADDVAASSPAASPGVSSPAASRAASPPASSLALAASSPSSRRDALLSLASLVSTASPALLGTACACPSIAGAATESGAGQVQQAASAGPLVASSAPNPPVAVAEARRAQTVYAGYCIPIIEKYVTAPLGDCLALAVRDAASFDAGTNTGGLNGSIRFELDRPENQKFKPLVAQLTRAKEEIDAKVSEPIGWADLIALAAAGKARYTFLREFCGAAPRFDQRRQYRAKDVNTVGCDYSAVLTPPYGGSAEQVNVTTRFREVYAGTGPLTGLRMGRTDAAGADAEGMVPAEGSSAMAYKAWFARMRLGLAALVALAPYVDATCEATMRADAAAAPLFAELDAKRVQPGTLEKPLIKTFRDLTLRGPGSAEAASLTWYVRVLANGRAVAAIPLVSGKEMKSVRDLMTEYTDVLPVWIL